MGFNMVELSHYLTSPPDHGVSDHYGSADVQYIPPSALGWLAAWHCVYGGHYCKRA